MRSMDVPSEAASVAESVDVVASSLAVSGSFAPGSLASAASLGSFVRASLAA